jgi:putative pyruvate formate lyase activating enzyme
LARGKRSGSVRPAYLDLIERGELRPRLDRALALIESCTLCPRNCRVDRPNDETGVCRIGRRAVVSSAHPHFGEERPLVGTRGSGTIFFSGCNLRCLFCQNYEISHFVSGREVSGEELAGLMLHLQEVGCHNLNLVTPTHVVPQILEGLEIAAREGFELPLVYNTGGYDAVEALRLLDGIVDIYMPDIKFLSGEAAEKYTAAADYPDVVRSAVIEMHRQVGDLVVSEEGVAARGLLVRHLVMPGMLDDTRRVFEFIAGEISPNTYVNVMRQYRPEYKACDFPPIDEPLSREEWSEAVAAARAAGLGRLDEG